MFSTKKLCRAGIISALYVALTLIFAPFAFGPIQVRPAEAVLGLFVGCALSNLASPFVLYDVCFGAGATLLAGLSTYFIGKKINHTALKITVGGIFPVLLNALIIPFIIVVLCGDTAGHTSAGIAYVTYAVSIFATEAVWVYGLGTPLYLSVKKLQKTSTFFK